METVAEPIRPASMSPRPVSRPSSYAPSAVSGTPTDEGRFPPGTLLLDRYRIIALLGRGGMGEVYRATDLKLSESVALKFLPESAARDARTGTLPHNEVRIARQVSHPNVCRTTWMAKTSGRCCGASAECPRTRLCKSRASRLSLTAAPNTGRETAPPSPFPW